MQLGQRQLMEPTLTLPLGLGTAVAGSSLIWIRILLWIGIALPAR